MKINDVIVEAPMGMLKRAGLGIKKMVPGSAGHKAQGQLDTGKVANEWKKQYSVYLGRINQQPSTENLAAFLKQLGLDDDIVKGTVSETMFIERALTKPEVDKLLLTAAQKAASGTAPSSTVEPDSAATGTASSTASLDNAAAPAAAKSNTPNIFTRAAGAVKGMLSKKATPPKVEPTVADPATVPTAATPSTTASSAATPTAAKAAPAGGSVDSYVNNWAKAMRGARSKNQQITLAKEIIGFLRDRQGSPEAARGAQMAKAVLKRSAEPDVRRIAQSTAFAMERRIYAVASKILESVGLTWKDIGYKILVTESTADYVVISER